MLAFYVQYRFLLLLGTIVTGFKRILPTLVVFAIFEGGKNREKLVKMGIFSDFYPAQKWQKIQVWVKSFQILLQWFLVIAKIDIGHKMLAKFE